MKWPYDVPTEDRVRHGLGSDTVGDLKHGQLPNPQGDGNTRLLRESAPKECQSFQQWCYRVYRAGSNDAICEPTHPKK